MPVIILQFLVLTAEGHRIRACWEPMAWLSRQLPELSERLRCYSLPRSQMILLLLLLCRSPALCQQANRG